MSQSDISPWARREWMGRPVRVKFAPHWPVPVGHYVYDGYDTNGIWCTHADQHQRHILYYDLEEVTLR